MDRCGAPKPVITGIPVSCHVCQRDAALCLSKSGFIVEFDYVLLYKCSLFLAAAQKKSHLFNF